MASSSKSFSDDINMIESTELRYPDLSHNYNYVSSLPIQTGRLVYFHDFTSFDLETSLQDFVPILGSSNTASYYPHLIKIFYTNLSVNHDQTTITTMVHGKIISFDIHSLGCILNLPSYGIELPNIVPIDRTVFKKVLHSTRSTHFPWHMSNLKPHAQLVSKILSHNVYPKQPSKGFVPNEISLLIYAIFCSFPINWSSIIFNNMINFRAFRSLPFGYFITHILKYFNVPLHNDVVSYSTHVFDDTSFSEEGSPPQHSDDEGPSEADPAPTSELDIFSTLVDVQNTQDLLLKNQASLQQAFHSLKIEQDALLRKFHPSSDSE